MAEQAGGMANRFQIGGWPVARAHTIDEVLSVDGVTGATLLFANLRSLCVERSPPAITDDDVTLITADGRSFSFAVERIVIPDS